MKEAATAAIIAPLFREFATAEPEDAALTLRYTKRKVDKNSPKRTLPSRSVVFWMMPGAGSSESDASSLASAMETPSSIARSRLVVASSPGSFLEDSLKREEVSDARFSPNSHLTGLYFFFAIALWYSFLCVGSTLKLLVRNAFDMGGEKTKAIARCGTVNESRPSHSLVCKFRCWE
ncbi:unnamed protein product [Chondrus crispus]|uniref:Uncharacterized protein n=1 Tax=Chondrus crispus TaxID=2769 RepID=R7Q497_CHOCR|nr:unnamed protein product [Chondrus crispus]CDF33347.1 unnamed protein product [Chondrus crispus]|eukprot:XP_005713150.1 unnamed protein product [Chondrus crispus]